MKKILVLIDGFNYYHRIQDHYNSTSENLKWVNYWGIAEQILVEKSTEFRGFYISQLRLFTSIPENFPDKDKKIRHRNFLYALKHHLKDKDFDWIEGNFKKKERKCNADCKKTYNSWEEKETDVNIAIYLVQKAYQDEFEKCFLYTSDTDLAPAVKLVKENFPNKEVVIILPPGRGKVDALTDIYGKERKIQLDFQIFRDNQMPDEIMFETNKGKFNILNPYKKLKR